LFLFNLSFKYPFTVYHSFFFWHIFQFHALFSSKDCNSSDIACFHFSASDVDKASAID